MSDGLSLRLYRWSEGLQRRLLMRALPPSFMAFGADSFIAPPVTVDGADRISIGSRVYIGPGSWLFTQGAEALLEIGDGTRMSGYCVLSAVSRVTVGRSVLFGRNVYVADNSHGIADPAIPVVDQPLEDIAPVSIGDGSWLGQNVVILSGVSIGAGAVVGANSVVREDVPPRTVAAGVPAAVVRSLD